MSKDTKKAKMTTQKKISIAVTVILILSIVLCLYVAIQVMSRGYVNLFGFSLFRVVTGSMEPTIPMGSLLLMKHVDMDMIGVGDIICFKAQDTAIFGKMMTHRVMEILPAKDGRLMFMTKGDANIALDGYLVTSTNFVGKVVWFTGQNSILAKVFSVLTNKIGFLSCIVMPCFLLSSLVMKDLMNKMHLELEMAMRELEDKPVRKKDVILDMSQEDKDAMYERIRSELMEELLHDATKPESKTE